MTVVHPNHIVGINSITVQTGDSLSVHKADGSLIRTIVSNTGVSTFHAIEVSKGGGDLTVGISTLFVDNSAGRIGINSAVPTQALDVIGTVKATSYSGDGSALTGIDSDKISEGNTEVETVDTGSDGHVKITTEGSERARIDTAGRLLIGTTDTDSVSDGEVPKLIIKATDSTAAAAFVRHSSNSGGTGIFFGKSRNATIGSNTIVQSGDELGRITFSGDDGTNINTMGAKIASYVDGTPGENDMPGRLVFYTTADGASSVTERARIDSSGRLLVGHTSSEALFYTGSIQVQGTNSSTSAITVKSNQNDSGGPAIVLGKSRSGSVGGNTVVQSGDEFGCIYFNGADGTDTISQGAYIRGSCDGTPGADDMPGRITFGTAADGASSSSERLRIDSSGRVLIGATSTTAPARLAVNGCTTGAEAFFELNRTDDPTNGQNVGVIEFSQGNSASRLAARLMTRRDGGVWGASSLPTRFEFHTCISGSNTAAERFRISSNGNVLPGADATQDLGTTDKRWANIYSADLQLSNEGSENEVDGSWGSYTIQEGETNLFLINRRNGKKYTFNLTEVS